MGRFSVTLAVVAVVLLAGCSGFVGDDTGDDELADTDGIEAELPAGYDETGVTDVATAAEGHETAAGDADGIELQLETTQQTGETSLMLEQHERIDQLNDVALSESRTGDNTQKRYRTADGTIYVRAESPDGVRYRTQGERLDDSVQDVSEFLRLFDGVDLTHEHTDRNGVSAFAYELDESTTVTIDDQELSLDSASLVVDEHSRLHSLSITATADDAERSISAEFSYGAIDIAEPDWLDEAIEATGEDF